MNLASIVTDTFPSVSHPDDAVCCSASDKGASSVGPIRLSDSQREAAIKRAGDLMLKRHAVYAATGCLAALGDAHRALEMQRQLIAGRSAEQIARMELERGLR